MAKHDSDDVYWNRYRERSRTEVEHFMRKRRQRALDENQTSDQSALPKTTEDE